MNEVTPQVLDPDVAWHRVGKNLKETPLYFDDMPDLEHMPNLEHIAQHVEPVIDVGILKQFTGEIIFMGLPINADFDGDEDHTYERFHPRPAGKKKYGGILNMTVKDANTTVEKPTILASDQIPFRMDDMPDLP